MSDESGLAYQQAKADYQASRAQAGLTGQDPAAVSPAALLEAASAHLAASRPLAEALAEYEPLLELLSADQSFDREALATSAKRSAPRARLRRTWRATCPVPGIPPRRG